MINFSLSSIIPDFSKSFHFKLNSPVEPKRNPFFLPARNLGHCFGTNLRIVWIKIRGKVLQQSPTRKYIYYTHTHTQRKRERERNTHTSTQTQDTQSQDFHTHHTILAYTVSLALFLCNNGTRGNNAWKHSVALRNSGENYRAGHSPLWKMKNDNFSIFHQVNLRITELDTCGYWKWKMIFFPNFIKWIGPRVGNFNNWAWK